MFLRHKSFLDQESSVFERRGLTDWMTQLMSQEGVKMISYLPRERNNTRIDERITLRITSGSNADTIIPVFAHDFCYLDHFYIASWGPHGLLVSDSRSGRVMAKMRLPLTQDRLCYTTSSLR